MKITLVLVGKTKEAFVSEALKEYKKRINKYVHFDIEEVSVDKNSKKFAEKEIRSREGKRILKLLSSDSLASLIDCFSISVRGGCGVTSVVIGLSGSTFSSAMMLAAYV